MRRAWLLLLLLPGTTAAPYLQFQGDGANTGVIHDPGPPLRAGSYDLAGSWDLPGLRALASPPIVAGDVFVLRTGQGIGTSYDGEGAGMWKIPLRGGGPVQIYEAENPETSGLVSDGELLVFGEGPNIVAIDFEGHEVWKKRIPFETGEQADGLFHSCAPGAHDRGFFYMACTRQDTSTQAPIMSNYQDDAGFVGESRLMRLDRDGRMEDVPLQVVSSANDARPLRAANIAAQGDLLALQGVPIVSPNPSGAGFNGVRVLIFDASSLQAHCESSFISGFSPTDEDSTPLLRGEVRRGLAMEGESVYLYDGRLVRYAAAQGICDGTRLYQADIGSNIDTEAVASLILKDSTVFMASSRRMDTFNLNRAVLEQTASIPGMDMAALGSALEVTGTIFLTGTDRGVFSVDTETGETMWSIRVGVEGAAAFQDQVYLAVGDGLLVVAPSVGPVQIYGETGHNPPPLVEISTTLLAPRATLTLTSDDDQPMTVDWGDGSHADLVTSASHQFETPGTYQVVVRSSTPQGTTASIAWVVRVADPTPQATFLETAFSQENQESSFFILGLLVTMLFAGFGFVRLRRKRSVLRKELEAADAVVTLHHDDADAMRSALREHRKRARRLFLAGRLDEGSAGILERHVDELLRDHRLSKVEAELGFLPHALFRAMQEMLRDAKVTQLERNQFLDSLAAARSLSASERGKVKRFVEGWYQEDAS